MRTLLTSLSVSAFCLGASAQAPSIDRIQPAALAPGRATALTLVGDHLDRITEFWTSFPATTEYPEVPTTDGKPGRRSELSITAPKKLQPGIGAIRAGSPVGVSPWHLMVVDPYKTLRESGTNRSPARARRIADGEAIDGRCEELSTDYYVIAGRRNRELSIDVVAARIGSAMDPFVRLLDSSGRSVASMDDSPGLLGDAALRYTPKQRGDYLLEVRDTQFRGGKNHRYRLRISSKPIAPLPFLGSNFPKPAIESLPLLKATELMETPAGAKAVSWPVRIEGRFETPGDRDLFPFDAGKGDRLIFRGSTRSIGSPCDLFLQLQSTNGRAIATANLGPGNEGTLTNTFNAAGRYHLLVEELNRGGGARQFYRVEIEPFGPRFQLSVEKESVQVTPGKTNELKVTVERRDFDGDITLEMPGLPAGYRLKNAVLKGKAKDTKLQIIAPDDAKPGQWFHTQVVGRGKTKDAKISAAATTGPALRALWPDLDHPPEALDSWLAVGVRESDAGK